MKASTYFDEIAAALVPVPAVQLGVCRSCRSAVKGAYDRCYPCLQNLPSDLEITPILMEEEGELAHRHLRGYKSHPQEDTRRILRTRLAATLSLYLRHHRSCLGQFDMVATVPSKKQKRDAPRQIVAMVGAIAGLPNAELRCTDPDTPTFEPAADVDGRLVLVFDDTFTRGITIAAACAAVEQGGGAVVGPLVIGRYVNTRKWEPSKPLMAGLRGARFDIETCIHCSPSGGVILDPPIDVGLF